MDVIVRFKKDYEGHKSGSEASLPATLYWPLKQQGVVTRLKELSKKSVLVKEEESIQLEEEVNQKVTHKKKK
jgi:hypothetical protein